MNGRADFFAQWGEGVVGVTPACRLAAGPPMHVMVVGADAVSLGAFSVRVRALIRWLSARDHDVTLVTAAAVPPGDELHSVCRRVVAFPYQGSSRRIGRALANLFSLPDPFGPWARAVAKELPDMVSSGRPGAVLVSSPPHGIQLLGGALARCWRVPFVADLRDDWVGSHRARRLTPLHYLAARREEKRMARAASWIVANTPLLRRQFVGRHPECAHKVVTISNGFNEEEFDGLEPQPRGDHRLRVGYVGSDYNGFVPRLLADVSRRWATQGEDRDWRLVVCTGPTGTSPCVPAEVWEWSSLIAPAQSAVVMNGCDVLLLLMPPGEREPSPTVPLKTYSYLRTGLPVVYCGEQGATTELLKMFAGTFCVPRSTGRELADFISSRRPHWGRRYPREGVGFFSFEQVSLRLEALLRRAVEPHGELRAGVRGG